MPHLCLNESVKHWFRYWLVAYSAPSHCLNHCPVIFNCTLRNKHQRNIDQNAKIFIHENASENIVCEITANLPQSQCVRSMFNGITAAHLEQSSVCRICMARMLVSSDIVNHMVNTKIAPIQWETTFLCSDVTHWLRACLGSDACNYMP